MLAPEGAHRAASSTSLIDCAGTCLSMKARVDLRFLIADRTSMAIKMRTLMKCGDKETSKRLLYIIFKPHSLSIAIFGLISTHLSLRLW